ncbi:hypothetical protein [Microbacterium sp. NPDC091662]|uniref:hypothetical protein n=1 Tax=Microbacterium sp. NPDC091662 TaxID=3364211 RepID=UPI0037F5B66A
MAGLTADTLREKYLIRLDEAMRGLPHGVATDIRAGILEELHGLDADATAARIARLGDPAAIAREAQAELPAGGSVPVAAPVPRPSEPRPAATSTRGFAIATALVLSFGGIVVPVVGWFVGAVLVSLSSMWKTGEKVVAIVVPFVVGGLSILAISTMVTVSAGESSGSSSGTGTPPSVNNPLIPAWYDLIWMGVWGIGVLLIPLSGLWLLWRLRGRAAR